MKPMVYAEAVEFVKSKIKIITNMLTKEHNKMIDRYFEVKK